jgi:uncharacterized protein YbjT (DUF2867 family)
LSSDRTILITGVTGQQGGAVARALRGAGFHVRGLTRKPESEAAAAHVREGVEIVKGDLDDEGSVRRALASAWGVFGVQNTWEAGVEREEVQGKRLATLACEAGVQHFVYTSVGSAHKQTGIPHFENKWRVEGTVRNLGFPSHVILRPVFFMENLLSPFSLSGDTLTTAVDPATKLQMVAVDDIGRFGARAFTDAAAMSGRELDLAGDALARGGRDTVTGVGPADYVRVATDSAGPSVQRRLRVDAGMVRPGRLQRRHRWAGARVRPPARDAARLGASPRRVSRGIRTW